MQKKLTISLDERVYILTFRTPGRGLIVTSWRRCGILGDPGNYSGATEGTWHGRRDSVRHADCWFVAGHY